MPAATEYIQDSSHAQFKAQRKLADDEFAARTKLVTQHAKYYAGQFPNSIKIASGEPDFNINVNHQRQAIDRMIAFAVPEMPQVSLDEDAAISTDETLLRQQWLDKGGVTFLQDAMLLGSIAGHMFAWVQPDDLRTVLVQPEQIIAWWHPDTRDRLWYERRWVAGGVEYRQDVVPGNGNWLIYQFTKQRSEWELRDEIIWPHTLGPIIDWPHIPDRRHYYGKHDFQHVDLVKQINLVLSNTSKIHFYHGSPRIIITDSVGLDDDAPQDARPNDIIDVPSANARVVVVQPHAAAVTNGLQFAEVITSEFYRQQQVVNLPNDPRLFSNLTNLGIRATFMPMLNKARVLQHSYDQFIEQVSRRWLAYSNQPDPTQVTTHWQTGLPVDARENTQLARLQTDMGLLSKRGASDALNIDYDTEQARLADEPDLLMISALNAN